MSVSFNNIYFLLNTLIKIIFCERKKPSYKKNSDSVKLPTLASS